MEAVPLGNQNVSQTSASVPTTPPTTKTTPGPVTTTTRVALGVIAQTSPADSTSKSEALHNSGQSGVPIKSARKTLVVANPHLCKSGTVERARESVSDNPAPIRKQLSALNLEKRYEQAEDRALKANEERGAALTNQDPASVAKLNYQIRESTAEMEYLRTLINVRDRGADPRTAEAEITSAATALNTNLQQARASLQKELPKGAGGMSFGQIVSNPPSPLEGLAMPNRRSSANEPQIELSTTGRRLGIQEKQLAKARDARDGAKTTMARLRTEVAQKQEKLAAVQKKKAEPAGKRSTVFNKISQGAQFLKAGKDERRALRREFSNESAHKKAVDEEIAQAQKELTEKQTEIDKLAQGTKLLDWQIARKEAEMEYTRNLQMIERNEARSLYSDNPGKNFNAAKLEKAAAKKSFESRMIHVNKQLESLDKSARKRASQIIKEDDFKIREEQLKIDENQMYRELDAISQQTPVDDKRMFDTFFKHWKKEKQLKYDTAANNTDLIALLKEMGTLNPTTVSMTETLPKSGEELGSVTQLRQEYEAELTRRYPKTITAERLAKEWEKSS